jgi:hypothetical protein
LVSLEGFISRVSSRTNQFFVESYDIVTAQKVFRAMARIALTLIPLVMAWLCIVPMADGQDEMVSAR